MYIVRLTLHFFWLYEESVRKHLQNKLFEYLEFTKKAKKYYQTVYFLLNIVIFGDNKTAVFFGTIVAI